MTSQRRSEAVVDGELLSASASQVKQFLRCQRCWHLERVLRRTRDEGDQPWLAVGTALHAQMEAYYETGKTPEHSACREAVALAPPRGPNVLVEAALENPSLFVHGVRYKGFVDLMVPPTPEDPTVQIIDWKSCGDFKYVATPEALRRDVQMGSYGHYARLRWPEATVLRLAHIYLIKPGRTRKTKPNAMVVDAEATWDDVERTWAVVLDAVADMRRVAKIRRWEDVEPGPDDRFHFPECRPFSEALDSYEPESPQTPEEAMIAKEEQQ